MILDAHLSGERKKIDDMSSHEYGLMWVYLVLCTYIVDVERGLHYPKSLNVWLKPVWTLDLPGS